MEENKKNSMFFTFLDMMATQHASCMTYLSYMLQRTGYLLDAVENIKKLEEIKNDSELSLQCEEYALFLKETIDNLNNLKTFVELNQKSFVSLVAEKDFGINENDLDKSNINFYKHGSLVWTPKKK